MHSLLVNFPALFDFLYRNYIILIIKNVLSICYVCKYLKQFDFNFYFDFYISLIFDKYVDLRELFKLVNSAVFKERA